MRGQDDEIAATTSLGAQTLGTLPWTNAIAIDTRFSFVAAATDVMIQTRKLVETTTARVDKTIRTVSPHSSKPVLRHGDLMHQ